jgi:sarcosine oxidase subunit beta
MKEKERLPMTKYYEAAVIGAGFLGSFVAYFLAKHGVDTCLVERAYPAAGTSGATPAWVGYASRRPVHYAKFARESSSIYRQLEEEYGVNLGYNRRGALIIQWTEADFEAAKEVVADQRKHGIECELLTADEVVELEPVIEGANIAGAIYGPNDAHVFPFMVLHTVGYLAQELGAVYQFYTAVTDLEQDNGAFRLGTDTGEDIVADKLCVAAGAWSNELLAMLDIDIPAKHARGEYLISQELPPVVDHVVGSGSLHQFERPGAVMLGRTAKEVGVFSSDSSWKGIQTLLTGIMELTPKLADTRIIRAIAATRPLPYDDLPLLGEIPGEPGLFLAVTHSGASVGPICGRVTADMMAEEEPSWDMTPYHIRRWFEVK